MSRPILVIAPAVAHIVMCEEIRDEIFEKVDEYLHWSRVQVLARYAPVLDAALWITPVTEGPHHFKVVQNDPGDTSCPAGHHPPALDPATRKWPCP